MGVIEQSADINNVLGKLPPRIATVLVKYIEPDSEDIATQRVRAILIGILSDEPCQLPSIEFANRMVDSLFSLAELGFNYESTKQTGQMIIRTAIQILATDTTAPVRDPLNFLAVNSRLIEAQSVFNLI